MLRIRNWDKWQTYRSDRGLPPYIKLHRRVLRDIEWAKLTDSQRGQLVVIWMLAADRNGEVPDDAELIQRMGMMTNQPDLNVFIELGFLERKQEEWDIGVNVTPLRRQND